MAHSPEQIQHVLPQTHSRREFTSMLLKGMLLSPLVLGVSGVIYDAEDLYSTYRRLQAPIDAIRNPRPFEHLEVMNRQADMKDLQRGYFISWGDSLVLGDFGGIAKIVVEKIKAGESGSRWMSVDGFAKSGTTTKDVLRQLDNPQLSDGLSILSNINALFEAAGNNFLLYFGEDELLGDVQTAVDTTPQSFREWFTPQTIDWYESTSKASRGVELVTKGIKDDHLEIFERFIYLKKKGADIQRIFLPTLPDERYADYVKIPRSGKEPVEIPIAGNINRENAAGLIAKHISGAVMEAANEILPKADAAGIQIIGVNYLDHTKQGMLRGIHLTPDAQKTMADILLDKCVASTKETLLAYLNRKIKGK